MRSLVALVVGLAAAPAWGWGCDAHRIVALLAWADMGDAARAGAGALLRAHPVDPADRGCRRPGRNVLADVAMWADAIRDDEPATASWHYVDVARGAARSALGPACREGRCVTAALRRELAVLRSDAPPDRRARALRFVVHLVADVHQPLHATTNGDKGGNCLPIATGDARPRASGGGARWTPNLHGFWDVTLVERVLERAGETPGEYADALRRQFAGERDAWRRGDRVEDWAWETHEVGVGVAYGRLPRRVPDEPHGRVRQCRENDDVGRRMAALGIRLDDAYVRDATPAVDRQLAKAGMRLAALLDAVWPPRR